MYKNCVEIPKFNPVSALFCFHKIVVLNAGRRHLGVSNLSGKVCVLRTYMYMLVHMCIYSSLCVRECIVNKCLVILFCCLGVRHSWPGRNEWCPSQSSNNQWLHWCHCRGVVIIIFLYFSNFCLRPTRLWYDTCFFKIQHVTVN